MNTLQPGYRRILVATDFSGHAEAALRQAVWLARSNGAAITLVHVLLDRQSVVLLEPGMAGGEVYLGPDAEALRNAQQQCADQLRSLVAKVGATDLGIPVLTLVGEPFVEITRFVKREVFDLVMTGSRGLAAWEQFFVGSTATRLIRKCPSSVWVVREEHVGPPKTVLAATDFSDLSKRAVLEAWRLAERASAQFHLLHVIDSLDIPEDVIANTPQGNSVRNEVNERARLRLNEFATALGLESAVIHHRLSWGTPWKEIGLLARHLNADVIAMGTVGRSGIKGMLLGNTAERVLRTCECGILTVKPADFESPIA